MSLLNSPSAVPNVLTIHSGISVATGRNLLMVGENLDVKPLDYHDLLRKYKNAADAAAIVHDWSNRIEVEVKEVRQEALSDVTTLELPEQSLINFVRLGDYVAENELVDLGEYFVETADFEEALNGGYQIFVGRKGSGKSAVAHMVEQRLSDDQRQIVQFVSPQRYELSELLNLVRGLDQPIQQRFVAGLWKYVLSTEAIRAIWNQLKDKPLDSSWSPEEEAIRDLVDSTPEIEQLSFTSRVVGVVRAQGALVETEGALPESLILGRLQSNIINQHRDVVASYLSKSGRHLTIIIDDIVPTWRNVEERQQFARILLSLLEGSRELWREWDYRFGTVGARAPTILLFARADIFASVLHMADEPDKIDRHLVYWEDLDSLLDLVGKRIQTSIEPHLDRVANWQDDLLDPEISTDSMKALIETSVLFRPRDVIYYFTRVFFMLLEGKQAVYLAATLTPL